MSCYCYHQNHCLRKNFSEQENTWEPEYHLEGNEALFIYHEYLKQKTKTVSNCKTKKIEQKK